MTIEDTLRHIQNIADDPQRYDEVCIALMAIRASISNLNMQLIIAKQALKLYGDPEHWRVISWESKTLSSSARKHFILESHKSGCGNYFAEVALQTIEKMSPGRAED